MTTFDFTDLHDGKHLVEHDAKGVDVNRFVRCLSAEDFGGEVHRRADEIARHERANLETTFAQVADFRRSTIRRQREEHIVLKERFLKEVLS